MRILNRNLFSIVCLVFIFIGCTSSPRTQSTADIQGKILFQDIPQRQFVLYHDTRGDQNRLTGLFKISKENIICHTVDLNTKTKSQVEFKVIRKHDGRCVLSPQGDFQLSNEIDIQFLFADWINIANQYITMDKQKFPADTYQEDPWPEAGYTIEHRFSYWVPFFKLRSLKIKGEDKEIFKLIALGWIRDIDSMKLYLRDNFPKGNVGTSFTIEPKKKKVIIQKKLKYTLDDNWKHMGKQPQEYLPHETYWITSHSRRDAQIGVEEITIPNFNSLHDLIGRFICSDPFVFASSIVIKKTPTGIRYSCTDIDPRNNIENFAIMKYSL